MEVATPGLPLPPPPAPLQPQPLAAQSQLQQVLSALGSLELEQRCRVEEDYLVSASCVDYVTRAQKMGISFR
jgi:hypothetical protein